jgi:anti-sigma factor RsiW
MECNQVRGMMLDVVVKLMRTAPELENHLGQCVKCSSEFAALRATMDLLDEWQVPEPSQEFDTQLRERFAQLSEERRSRRSIPQSHGVRS